MGCRGRDGAAQRPGRRGRVDRAAGTAALVDGTRDGDDLVLMSNGSVGGLHERLLAALRARDA